jgi:hypothetical protein
MPRRAFWGWHRGGTPNARSIHCALLEPEFPGDGDAAGIWLIGELLVGAGEADMVPPFEPEDIEDIPPCVVVEDGGVLPEDIPGAAAVCDDIDELSGAGPGVEVWASANPAEHRTASVAKDKDHILNSCDVS